MEFEDYLSDDEAMQVLTLDDDERDDSKNATIPSFLSTKDQAKEKRYSANMHAVFLHVLGDFLGSIAAISSGLVIHFVEDDWKFYVDPALRSFFPQTTSFCR